MSVFTFAVPLVLTANLVWFPAESLMKSFAPLVMLNVSLIITFIVEAAATVRFFQVPLVQFHAANISVSEPSFVACEMFASKYIQFTSVLLPGMVIFHRKNASRAFVPPVSVQFRLSWFEMFVMQL